MAMARSGLLPGPMFWGHGHALAVVCVNVLGS